MPVKLSHALNAKHSSAIQLEDRTRSWLRSAYADHIWVVADGAGEGKDETVSFDVRMADGRSLIEHRDLCASAKELLFWIRAGNYTRIDDAYRHKQYGDAIIRACYGLTARGFSSFADLTAVDIELICEDAAFGVDGLTRASKSLKEKLAEYQTWQHVPRSLIKNEELDLREAITAFHLPSTWARKEIKSELLVATARLNGKLLASVADMKERPITIQNIQLVTMLFDALYALRHFIVAPTIGFRPFPEGPAKKAEDLGSTTERTPIAPPDLVLTLLEESVRIVATQCESIQTGYKTLLDVDNRETSKRPEAQAMRARIETFVTACYILIAAFTARRREEIKMLERDCIAGNNDYGWWMKVYIEKTDRRRTWIPIPSIVARAVQILCSLDTGNFEDPGMSLFEYLDPVARRRTSLKPESRLNDFAKLVGAHEYTNEKNETLPWHWTTRQFRRFFAVLFIYRYKGKKETLAHHLRHFNLQMTNDYVTLDPDNARVWTREIWNFQIEIARDLVDGRTVYTGPMGDRLTKLVQRLKQKFSDNIIIVPERMARIVMRSMKKNQLVLTPKPWVTCSCPHNLHGCHKAACRKIAGFEANAIGPDFSAAGPTVCPSCPWALIAAENLAYIDEELQAMRVADNHEYTIFGELQAANIVQLSAFRGSLGIR
ncbi:integrase [Phyllobacterium trifolii]|uniref:Integrase n=1 Tax=Phyllobacterium trifolii TaxID=300193 RepID=A0A839UBG1_9HYPH|nr:hypothetical protein [Phyllobacterium trifolii]MBB3147203.1 integrase [Phyllobacterium trifolii]